MIVKAEALGADAVVGLRFSTSSIAQGASELFVYGTAVKVAPISQEQYQNPPSDGYNHSSQNLSTQTQVAPDDLPRFNPFG